VGFFPPGSEVSFEVGDVNELQFKDSSFDFIMMREIFQYLPEPNKAVAELFRVCSKGAYLFAEDIDDALYITWPPPHPSMQKLYDAIGDLQKSFDGDRNSGRKMSSYMRKAGFSINSASLISEAHHLDSNQVNYERGSIIMQLKAAKSRLLEVGAITEDEFDVALDDYQRADLGEQFRMAARVLLIAQKR
jgi:SAM-dependent methyltransferase